MSKSDTFDIKDLALRIGGNAATASSNAATLHKNSGVITSESLTTAAAGEYVLTLTNANAEVGDHFIVTAGLGTSTNGVPGVTSATCTTAGTVLINITNVHASAAFNGTIKIGFIRVSTK
jgi:hypothetical protein